MIAPDTPVRFIDFYHVDPTFSTREPTDEAFLPAEWSVHPGDCGTYVSPSPRAHDWHIIAVRVRERDLYAYAHVANLEVIGGMRCPQCGSDADLEILASLWVELHVVNDSTFETEPSRTDGAHEWNDSSPARCNACCWEGQAMSLDPDGIEPAVTAIAFDPGAST